MVSALDPRVAVGEKARVQRAFPMVVALCALSGNALAVTPDSPPPPQAPAPEADEASSDWDGGYDVKYTRRSDFTFGLSLGLGVGNGYGYPNEVDKIDDPAFVADTGVAPGSSYELWLGGALRDWLTFGIGLTGFGVEGDGKMLAGGGFVFRIEAFPFFGQGGALDDVGMFGSFGLGSATIEEDGNELADGGAISIVKLGGFWETWRFGGFALGPGVDYTHVFSQTLRYYQATAGFRLAFYAGP